MDLAELPVLLPSGGVLVVLVWLIVHVMRQASGDRSLYQEQLVELRRQHSDEIGEIAARHDTQIAELRDQLAEERAQRESETRVLRAEISDLRQQIEDERLARWKAEDAAAHYRRMITPDAGGGLEGSDDT